MAKSASEAGRLEGNPWTPYIYIAPIALYLLLFQGYPLVQELLLSFTSTSLLSPQDNVPVGLDNYRELLSTSDFHNTHPDHSDLHHRLRGAVDRARARGGAASRPAVPGARRGARGGHHSLGGAVGRGGAHLHLDLQRAIRRLQLSPSARSDCRSGHENWLDSPSLALPAILLTTVWQIFPFASVVLLAALQGVSSELREAAVIDGADRLSVFKAVVWPTIQPTVALLALFITIWSLRRFDLIWLMTQGGPIGATNTLVIELYRQGFVYRQLGLAAAVGMIGLSDRPRRDAHLLPAHAAG